MPLGLDIVTRVTNVQWGKVDLQGLVAEWPGFQSTDGNLIIGNPGPPTAYAIDSAQSFTDVNMGASGLGKTVMTKGLVCFGAPRDGAACFIACSDYVYFQTDAKNNVLKRGTIDPETGDLKWDTVGGGKGLVALTFAGDAFFAVYKPAGDEPTRIETSYDGTSWSGADVFPVLEDDDCCGGAVASIGEEDSRKYVSVGAVSQQDNDNYVTIATNLAWATGTDGTDWAFEFDPGMMSEPGALPGMVYIGSNQVCTVCGGKDIFVAATCKKTELTTVDIPPDILLKSIFNTAAVAVSTDGSSWSNAVLPGATPGGVGADSQTLAVVFVKKTKNEGYFLASSREASGGGTHTNLWKSSDGQTWTQIKTGSGYYHTLSAVSKNLDAATIVRLD